MRPSPAPAAALALTLALALAAGAAGPAQAASLQISPVSLRFALAQQAAVITLQNMGEAPIYGQVRLYRWDQRDGEDVLTATREVLASPPIVQIAPHASQAIRLVLAPGLARASEGSYRILIDELGREEGGAAQGVDIRLRYSVPVFVAGAAAGEGMGTAPAAAPTDTALAWQLLRRDGAWMLRVRNDGDLHAQIGALAFTNRAGERFDISRGLFGYVLAGRERLWKLPVAAEARLDGAVSIQAVINARAPASFVSAAQ